MISLTEKAAERVAELGIPGISVSVKPSGCNGYSYIIKEWEPSENEVYYTDKDVKVFIAKEAEPFLIGTAIDYVSSPDGFTTKFDIVSSIESGRCGCGESFNIDNPKI